MLLVRLITDPFDLGSYSEHQPEQLIPFLQSEFPEWPPTARLYKGNVSQDCDVTPLCEADLERLTDDGLYYVIVYPADPTTLLIIAIAVFVVATVALLMLMPKAPGAGPTLHTISSNNSIGNRVNKPRPNERIPDIFGKIEAVPELLTQPMIIFDSNKEFELCYMCVGRGEYFIDPDQVYDGKTPLYRMAGAAADFYGPGTRPDNGDPFLEIGGGVGYPLRDVVRLNDVNGQQLKAPNANMMNGSGQVQLVGPQSIVADPGSGIDFTKQFDSGDTITLTTSAEGASGQVSKVARFYPDQRVEFSSFDPSTTYLAGDLFVISNGAVTDGTHSTDVSGTYSIVSATPTTLQLANTTSPDPASPPLSVWTALSAFTGGVSPYKAINIGSAVPATTNFSGTYTVLTVTEFEIVLDDPGATNAAWAALGTGQTAYIDMYLSTDGMRWIGPFIIDMDNCEGVVCNFVCQQGLWMYDKKGQPFPISVSAIVEVTPVDENDDPVGSPVTQTCTITNQPEPI